MDDRLFTDVPDEISQSTTWTQEESPYYVNSSVSMAHGETLTIEQGVVVYMGIGASLDIQGATLDVRGTAEEPVTFAPKPDLGSESTWNGISVSTELGQEDHPASVSLENAVIEGALWGIDANPDSMSPTLSVTVYNSVFSNNSCGILASDAASISVQNSYFINSPVCSENSMPTPPEISISDSTFIGSNITWHSGHVERNLIVPLQISNPPPIEIYGYLENPPTIGSGGTASTMPITYSSRIFTRKRTWPLYRITPSSGLPSH